jgi:hypothetical protein
MHATFPCEKLFMEAMAIGIDLTIKESHFDIKCAKIGLLVYGQGMVNFTKI